MSTIISHQTRQAPAEDPFRSVEDFIASGHDPEIDHWLWMPKQVEEYAEFNQQHQAQTGGQR